MSAFSVLLVFVAAIALCSAGVAKRQATESFDMCLVSDVQVQEGSEFSLTSPNYGFGNYRDYINCATVLQSGEVPLQLTFTFNAVDIEDNSQCSYDSLCIGVKFCGRWASKKSFRFLLPEFSKFTVRFQTDSSVTGPGFSAYVQASIATPEDEIFQPDSGVGSAANKISYKQVSYYPGYANSYIDRCAGDNNQQYGYNSSTPWYNGTWNNYTSPSYNGSWNWNNYTSPSYNGSWNWNNYTSPSYNGSANWNNRTTPSYNGSGNWNNRTTPSYNGSGNWNNYTSPSYNGSGNWNNYTSPSYNGSVNWNNRTTPSYNGSGNWNNYTSPSYNGSGNWNNYTSPSYNGSGNWNNNTSSPNYEARFVASTTSRRPVSNTPWPTSTTRRPPTSTTRRPTTAWGG